MRLARIEIAERNGAKPLRLGNPPRCHGEPTDHARERRSEKRGGSVHERTQHAPARFDAEGLHSHAWAS
jgi:hypothetical protein